LKKERIFALKLDQEQRGYNERASQSSTALVKIERSYADVVASNENMIPDLKKDVGEPLENELIKFDVIKHPVHAKGAAQENATLDSGLITPVLKNANEQGVLLSLGKYWKIMFEPHPTRFDMSLMYDDTIELLSKRTFDANRFKSCLYLRDESVLTNEVDRNCITGELTELFSFTVSAEQLFNSEELGRDEFETLVNTIFARAKLLIAPLQDSDEDFALTLIVKRNGEEVANKHEEMKELAHGKEREHHLKARRGKCHKSPFPEKGGYVSGDMKEIFSSKAFIKNGSGDKGITPDRNKGSRETFMARNTVLSMVKVSNDVSKVRYSRSDAMGSKETNGLSLQYHQIYSGNIFYLVIAVTLLIQALGKNHGMIDSTLSLYFALLIAIVCFNIGICTNYKGIVENATNNNKTMEKNHDEKDCMISGIEHVLEETTGKALTSNSDTQTLCQFMWHKWFPFCTYNMCLVTFYAVYLTLNGFKKNVTALMNNSIGWIGATISPSDFATDERIAKSFAANLTAMKHSSPISHLLAPHVIPAKYQRKRSSKESLLP